MQNVYFFEICTFEIGTFHIKGLVGDLQGKFLKGYSKKYGARLPCFAKNAASLVATDGFTRPKEAQECSARSIARLGAGSGDVEDVSMENCNCAGDM